MSYLGQNVRARAVSEQEPLESVEEREHHGELRREVQHPATGAGKEGGGALVPHDFGRAVERPAVRKKLEVGARDRKTCLGLIENILSL